MIGVGEPFSPEKWARLREIYAQALELPAEPAESGEFEEQRMAMALGLCEGDSELECRLKSLLSAHFRAGSFLMEPAMDAIQDFRSVSGLDNSLETLAPGTVLASRFEIRRRIDAGGMGTIYAAWDSELKDEVALKTIRPEIASDPKVIDRFKQEVKQARQIAHRNICRVYDLFCHEAESGERIWFLTMQLLEGRTLLEHLRDAGPFKRKEALRLIEQMVAGLSAAHEVGVVHRDFKSSNIMLVPEEGRGFRVAITDFGLALPAERTGDGGVGRGGQGTPAYMPPEQWLDGAVSPAADQYALGVVICEMTTGQRPYLPGLSPDGAVHARLPGGNKLPPRWKKTICRCLENRPEERFPSVTAVLEALDPHRRRRTWARLLTFAFGVPSLAVAALLAAIESRQGFELVNPQQITPAMNLSEAPSLSSDGETVAYHSDRAEPGNLDIWVRLPDGGERRITSDPAIDDEPSISPDGRLVAFESLRSPHGIYLAQVHGGGERLLIAGGQFPRFSPDGRSLVYSTGEQQSEQAASGRIYRYDLATGKSMQLAPSIRDAEQAVWNSDGHHVLFKGCLSGNLATPGCEDWWVVDVDVDGSAPRPTGAVAILKAKHISVTGQFAAWQGDRVVFIATLDSPANFGSLWEIDVSPKDARARGPVRRVTSGDSREVVSYASLAGDQLAIAQMTPAYHIWRIDTASAPKRAKLSKITQHPDLDLSPSISSNGRWLAFVRGYSIERPIYLRNMQTGTEVPLSFPGISKLSPICDGSGTVCAYQFKENSVPGIMVTRPGQAPLKLCSNCVAPTGWLKEPDSLLFDDSSRNEVRVGDVKTGASRRILSVPSGSVGDANWSPENQYLLFVVSRQGANDQVVAARFPAGAQSPDTRWFPISEPDEVGRSPRWSGDGRTIFYLSDRDNFLCLWARHFDPASGRAVGEPFAVQHFHDERLSPSQIHPSTFNLSVAGDSVYFNLQESGGTIWLGKLKRKSLFSVLR